MRKTIFILTIIFFSVSQINGQKNKENLRKIKTGNWLDLSYRVVNGKGEEQAFLCVEQMPDFPGGYDALAKFFTRTLKYPKTAINDNVEGLVITRFSIDRNGKVRNIIILKGVRKDLNSECVKAISLMPSWSKTKYRIGDDVMIQFTLPIKFILK